MPITVTKAKEKPVVAAPQVSGVEPSELSDEDLADLYGGLQDRVAALMMDPLFVQFEEARKELVKRLDVYEPLDEIEIKGKHWLLEVGVCSKSPRKITDIKAVQAYLGKEDFMKIVKISVGDAEKYLTPEQVASVASAEAYTKNRKVEAKFLG